MRATAPGIDNERMLAVAQQAEYDDGSFDVLTAPRISATSSRLVGRRAMSDGMISTTEAHGGPLIIVLPKAPRIVVRGRL